MRVLRILAGSVSFMALLLALSCTRPPDSTPAPGAEADSHSEQSYVFYPSPPDQPRIQFLMSIDSALDIEIPKSSFFRFVVGEERQPTKVINKPYGVDLAGDRMYVCDTRGGLVVVDFKDRSFDIWGKDGQLIRPFNVDTDPDSGEAFVVDVGRRQIVVFDREGRQTRLYGSSQQLDRPSDVCVYKDRVYVCDTGLHCVHVIDRNTGEFLSRIGEGEEYAKALHYPTNIDIVDDILYVSDTGDFRVMKYDLRGRVVDYFGQVGKSPGSFARPKGISVDRSGRMYVVDGAFFNVQIFDKENRLLLYFPYTAGTGTGQLYLPTGIAISYDVPEYLSKLTSPDFTPRYLIAICSQYGNKVNLYAFGDHEK